jgi:hypothetical protein
MELLDTEPGVEHFLFFAVAVLFGELVEDLILLSDDFIADDDASPVAAAQEEDSCWACWRSERKLPEAAVTVVIGVVGEHFLLVGDNEPSIELGKVTSRSRFLS